ncbi:MAG: hypothetical protein IJ859_13540 [Synergistaceae bacterium]|nr:hypothetical protein [Synergistaceae bacterium]
MKNFNLDKILSSSWTLWGLSILLAFGMWIYVTGLEESEYITRQFSCPIEYRGLDSQTIIRGRLSEADIEIRGSEEAIMRLDYNSVKAYVDARNLVPGKRYTVNINVDLPPNINLVSCFPSQATLDLVRQVTRLMTVETVLPQNIPEGHYIEGVEIIPKEVGIRGAEDDVVKIGSVRITPTIEELQEGGERLMAVKFSQSEAFEGNVTVEPAQVRFHGNLVRGLPRKRVPVNVRLTGKLDDDYEIRAITTDPSEVQIEGKLEDLAKIETIDTEVIDVSSTNENQNIVAPLRQPEVEGVSLVNNSSVRVSLQLSEARAETLLTNIPVELRNANPMQNWEANPSSVSITIEGRPSLISKFSREDINIKAYVDMTNIFMTPVTLPVKAEIVSNDYAFRITKIDPQNITINDLENGLDFSK